MINILKDGAKIERDKESGIARVGRMKNIVKGCVESGCVE